MKILALEPFYGGSHQHFLDGWVQRSRHEWTVLGLSAHHWKWRMRHAAITLAERVAPLHAAGQRWDAIFCSDMLNLAEFRGLSPAAVAHLPAVMYFHENQWTYPVREANERDYHFAFSNLVSALAADRVWFNTDYHRNEMLEAMRQWLSRMPDHASPHWVERIASASSVFPPGVEPPAAPVRSSQRAAGPLRILWAARWEHDKDPATFFAALRELASRGVEFQVSVIGQKFQRVPPIFDESKRWLAARVLRWGYQATRADYLATLAEADVIVSTAKHEFFGIAVVEAILAGAFPLLPRRLAYPEILPLDQDASLTPFFYDGSSQSLVERLAGLAARVSENLVEPWRQELSVARRYAERFAWSECAVRMDEALGEQSS